MRQILTNILEEHTADPKDGGSAFL